jgi:rRNA-processing protein EBP2
LVENRSRWNVSNKLFLLFYSKIIERQGNDNSTNADDDFDVALASDDEEMKSYKTSDGNGTGKKRSSTSTQESRGKRHKKDQKFGFGGKKRFGKSNDANSSADVSGFNVKRNKSTSFKSGHKAHKAGGAKKGGAAKQRPGKGRRQNGAGRK